MLFAAGLMLLAAPAAFQRTVAVGGNRADTVKMESWGGK